MDAPVDIFDGNLPAGDPPFVNTPMQVVVSNGTLGIGEGTGVIADANSIDVLACDPTSWIPIQGSSTIGTNNCSTTGPTGIQGQQGIPGPRARRASRQPRSRIFLFL